MTPKLESSITSCTMHQFTQILYQHAHQSTIYTNITKNLRIREVESWPLWRTEPGIVFYEAQQCLKSPLWCLLKWLMINWMLQYARIQLNLQTPWMLQALSMVQYATICFDSTSKSPQKHLMSMNSSIEKVLVWRNWKIFWEKILDDFWI